MICPYCKSSLEKDAPALACARCGTAVHPECAQSHGRCVVYGCRGRRHRPHVPDLRRGRIQPTLPARVRLRLAARGALLAALTPPDDAALILLGVGGLVGLLLLG